MYMKVQRMKVEYYLYEIRSKGGMSQRGLARLSGVSHGQIGFIENEKVSPTVDVLCRLAVALKVSPYDLFSLIK